MVAGRELVSVDGPKRGKYDRQIPLAVRTSYTRAMDCNGNGLCFTFETDSPMCPSVKISRDRRHSPKGRAGLMREWLRQLAEQGFDPLAEEVALQSGGVRFKQLVDKVRNSWAKQRGEYDFSHEVMEAMAGCLACKACTSQCPIKVDVPDFRARFMQLYHGRYLRAPKDYFVGTVESYAPLLAKAPKLVNFFLEKEWAQKATEKSIGMVDVPLLSVPTLAETLHDNRARYFDLPGLERMSAEQRQQVVLIVQDPFTSYYDAPVVRDLVKLASKLGFQPYLLPFKPNGKPQHIKGFLRAFARTAANSAQFLNKVAALGIPMVGVDPAMVLCYRDEYAKALGSARGDFQVLLPQEWLLSLPTDQLPVSANKAKSGEGSEPEPWYLFAHCTEKTAKPSTHGDWSTLFGRFGASLQPVAVGCCGMAGTYGHDVKQVENSKGIYGLSWADPLARLPKARCLATGYSCRSQVKRSGGGEAQTSIASPAGAALMLRFPKRFRVPKAYRHPRFLLLPATPAQAVVEFVAMLREREQLHQLFRPNDIWPSANFSLSQHQGDLEWQQSELSGQALLCLWPMELSSRSAILGRGLPLPLGVARGSGGALLLEGGRGAHHG